MDDPFWNEVGKDAYEFWRIEYPGLIAWDNLKPEGRAHFIGMAQRVVHSVVNRATPRVKATAKK